MFFKIIFKVDAVVSPQYR